MSSTVASSLRHHWGYYLLVIGLTILFAVTWQHGPRDLTKAARLIESAHAAGDIARTHEYVSYWLTVVSRVGFFMCLGLLVAGPWLVRGPSRETTESASNPTSLRWLWIVAAAVTLYSGVVNAARLDHSFWFDEEATARRFIVGEFSGTGEFAIPKWERTLFYYNDPNNHPLCSVLGRMGHGITSRSSGPHDFHFHEWAIRLPIFLFGLAGLLALAWLAAVVNQPRAGMIAVALLALHPWYVRYSVEARGYALLFALAPLGLGCLLRALQTSRLGWFLSFGVLEFLCLWSYPAVLYMLILVNLAALAWMVLNQSPGMTSALRWTLIRRFSAGNLVGALLAMLVLTPLVPPMLAYLRSGRMRGEVTASMMVETVSGLFTGQPWAQWGSHENALAVCRMWLESPATVILLAAGVAVGLGAGLVALARHSEASRWIFPAVLGTAPFMTLMARLQGNILYPWYVVFILPVLVLILAMGFDFLGEVTRRRFGTPWIPLIAIGLYGMFTWRQNVLLRNFPIEPMRESVVAMRPVVNPFLPQVRDTLSGSLTYSLRLYDPWASPLKSVPDLQALMAKADATHRPLVINFANLNFARLRFPEVMAILENRDLFQPDPPFNGIHSQPERWVFRYLGPPLNTNGH